jgi:hypothetical protein
MTTLSFHPVKLIPTGEGGAGYRERLTGSAFVELPAVADAAAARSAHGEPRHDPRGEVDQDDVLRALEKVFAHYAP